MPTIRAQLIASYTLAELRYELSAQLGRPLSPRTFSYWRKVIGIVPNEFGRYEHSDLEILQGWIRHKSEFQTIENYSNFVRKAYATRTP